jgi:hypothetical protein
MVSSQESDVCRVLKLEAEEELESLNRVVASINEITLIIRKVNEE